MSKKVSIIIPAYNASAFIRECLDSILSQIYPDFEVVVVNDGSKDNTLEILNEYAQKDSRIKVFSQKNGGVSAARNTALSNISGDFLTCVDADDTLEENALKNMLSLMEDDVDLLVCSHHEVRFKKVPHLEKVNTFNGREDIDSRFTEFDRVIWWPWAKMFRASIIKDNALRYDTSLNFGEDHIFNLLFSKHMTGRVIVSDVIVYNYYYIRGGLCSKYYPKMHELQKYVYLKIEDYFGGADKIPYEYKKHYTGCYLKGCVDYYAAWLSFPKAADAIKASFEIYEDITDEETLKEFFTEKQYGYIRNKNYKAFTRDYIVKNPRLTLVRKYSRYVRRFLESLQKKFIK